MLFSPTYAFTCQYASAGLHGESSRKKETRQPRPSSNLLLYFQCSNRTMTPCSGYQRANWLCLLLDLCPVVKLYWRTWACSVHVSCWLCAFPPPMHSLPFLLSCLKSLWGRVPVMCQFCRGNTTGGGKWASNVSCINELNWISFNFTGIRLSM